MKACYLTHPQVRIDPAVPVQRWALSDTGRARMEMFAAGNFVRQFTHVLCSDETKAIEAAGIVADALGLAPLIIDHSGENDRSSTGFLEPAAFEMAADEFFAHPQTSFRGWERAIDAQSRIVGALEGVLADLNEDSRVLVVGHGAVGTLLKCTISGRPIDRREDQPAGGGNIFSFSLSPRTLLCDWTPMERIDRGLCGD